MKKYAGYTISLIGLGIMALGFGTFKLESPILNVIKPSIITIIGVLTITAGVIISLKFGKQTPQQITEEVPIYHGEKIVGYRKA